MKRRIFLLPAFVVVIALLLTVSFLYAEEREERDFLQDRIDREFDVSLSALASNLCNRPSDGAARAEWDEENKAYIHICTSLFSATSFRDNAKLNDVVRRLDLMEKDGTLTDLDQNLCLKLMEYTTFFTNEALLDLIHSALCS